MKLPAPTLAMSRLAAVVELKLPVKIVFAKSSRPSVNVAAVALVFVMVPLPVTDPTVVA